MSKANIFIYSFDFVRIMQHVFEQQKDMSFASSLISSPLCSIRRDAQNIPPPKAFLFNQDEIEG